MRIILNYWENEFPLLFDCLISQIIWMSHRVRKPCLSWYLPTIRGGVVISSEHCCKNEHNTPTRNFNSDTSTYLGNVAFWPWNLASNFNMVDLSERWPLDVYQSGNDFSVKKSILRGDSNIMSEIGLAETPDIVLARSCKWSWPRVWACWHCSNYWSL